MHGLWPSIFEEFMEAVKLIALLSRLWFLGFASELCRIHYHEEIEGDAWIFSW
jgi:hypothetical protein